MKYFKKIGLRTGFYVFDELSMILSAAIYILPAIIFMNVNLPCGIFSAFILFLAIVMRNRLKLLGPVPLIFFVTILHLVIGVFGIVVIIVSNVLIAMGKAQRINYAAQCWAGERRYDDERAREYGYKSVDDAINAGVMFDGTKLW